MAPQASSKNRRTLALGALIRYSLIAIAAGMVLTSAIYASQRFEQFLIRDSRFILPGPTDYGQESPNLEVTGTHYASRWQIQRIFEGDFGRSLYLFPAAARRKALLNVPWVHDAEVLRIWPNHIQVNIKERQAAAFVKLRAESMERWALIDEEGVILDPPRKASFHLPLLSGISTGESPNQRGVRVRRAMHMVQSLGNLSDTVAEVDVSDMDDLKLTEKVGGRLITLLMGDRNFASRLGNFFDHYPDIHRRTPQVSTFDLRLDDRITAVAGIN